MKATYWTCSDDPEGWHDNPCETPEGAVEAMFEADDDRASEITREIVSSSPQDVAVYGYTETDKLLAEDDWFDGYEPGQKYFTPTRETVRVRVSLSFQVLPKVTP